MKPEYGDVRYRLAGSNPHRTFGTSTKANVYLLLDFDSII